MSVHHLIELNFRLILVSVVAKHLFPVDSLTFFRRLMSCDKLSYSFRVLLGDLPDLDFAALVPWYRVSQSSLQTNRLGVFIDWLVEHAQILSHWLDNHARFKLTCRNLKHLILWLLKSGRVHHLVLHLLSCWSFLHPSCFPGFGSSCNLLERSARVLISCAHCKKALQRLLLLQICCRVVLGRCAFSSVLTHNTVALVYSGQH